MHFATDVSAHRIVNRAPGPPGSAPYRPTGVPAAAPPALRLPVLRRPTVITVASVLTVCGSLLLLAAVVSLWVLSSWATHTLDPGAKDQTVLFHLADRFRLRMAQGLAVPLIALPALSAAGGLLLPRPQPWIRLALTGAAILALGWSGWWLRHDLGSWLPPAAYVLVPCVLIWTPAATRWYDLATRLPTG